MANSDRPFGLKPVKHLLGVPWSGKANVYYIPATDDTDMFKGDAVRTNGAATDDGKFPVVVQATSSTNIRGVIIGFGEDPHVMIKPDNPYRTYRPASTAMYCLVVDDPFVIFEVQEDSVGAALTADQVGDTLDLVVGSGNTTTGLSGMELDSNTAATDNGQCRVLRVVDREDNALGDHCKWEVLIVDHELLAHTDVST